MNRKTALYAMCLVMAMSLVFLASASAADYTSAANKAKAKGITNLVVSIEGLMSKPLGFVRNGLVKYLKEKAQTQFASHNFGDNERFEVNKCIKTYRKVIGESLRVTIIGHSFGGGITTFKVLEKIEGIPVANVVTLDPRSWDGDIQYRIRKSDVIYKRPGNVEITNFLNFFQTGMMRGYQVKGARNVKIKAMHVAVPKNDQVRKAVLALLDDEAAK